MIGVFSGGVGPPVEFRVKNGEIKGMVTGASAEPSSSRLHPISLDKTCPADVELREYFCEVVGVWFAGLVVRVPPS
jgi:hypothetical protein